MKKIVKIAFVGIFMAITGYCVYFSLESNQLPNLILANVDALATGETGTDKAFIISYTRTISEEEGANYTEIVWENIVNCMAGGSEDCTPSRTTHVTRVYHNN